MFWSYQDAYSMHRAINVVVDIVLTVSTLLYLKFISGKEQFISSLIDPLG